MPEKETRNAQNWPLIDGIGDRYLDEFKQAETDDRVEYDYPTKFPIKNCGIVVENFGSTVQDCEVQSNDAKNDCISETACRLP